AQLAQRVHGVAAGAGAQFALVSFELRLVLQGEAQHRDAVLAGGAGRLAVMRRAGGNEEDLFERELAPRRPRHGEMRVVDRIEGAAQDPEACHYWRISPCPSTTNFCV